MVHSHLPRKKQSMKPLLIRIITKQIYLVWFVAYFNSCLLGIGHSGWLPQFIALYSSPFHSYLATAFSMN